MHSRSPAPFLPESGVLVSRGGSVGKRSRRVRRPGGKSLAVTLAIKTTGDSTIVSSASTVKAVTNKREYLQTTSSTLQIIPSGSIALTVFIRQ
jgi:hypothetical protein